MSNENGEKTQKLYKPTLEARELAERLFQESGFKFEGEFFAHVMSTFELQSLKNGLGAGYQKQISQLENHMRSVVDMFSAMLQTEAGERIQLSEGFEQKLNDRAEEIFAQQQEISEGKKREQLLAEEHARYLKLTADQQKDIANLQQINEKNEQILAENKERIDRLSKMVTEQSEAAMKSKELEDQLSKMTKISESHLKDLSEAREVTEALRTAHSEQIRQLESKHTSDLERTAEKAEIAQERSILAIRRELSEQAEKERSELMKQIQISERERGAEIRSLYGEMDKLRQQVSDLQQKLASSGKPDGPKVNIKTKDEDQR